jgi:phospholipase/carboxylesterase
MPIEKTVLGGLTTYVVSEIPAGDQPKLAVVLCHGYGASGRDLIGLTQAIEIVRPSVLTSTVFFYPAAPLDLSNMGIPYGRAWWHIDLDRLLNRPTPELLAKFRRNVPDGAPEARALLQEMLAAAGERLGLRPDQFVLGGFSQGSMLATDVALRMKDGPAALCILSGALVNELEWRELAARHSPLPVLQSHGRQDQILMYPQATALKDLLADAGHDVEFVAFDGGHEIPPVVVHRLAELLERLMSNPERLTEK